MGGNIYVADAGNDTIRKIAPSGMVTTVAGSPGSAGWQDGPATTALFNDPTGVALDSAGDIYVADFGNDSIRRIGPDGTVTTFAGNPSNVGENDGVGFYAAFEGPCAITADGAGVLFVADYYNNEIRRITPSATVTTFAGTNDVCGSADGTGSAARFNMPWQVCLDSLGRLYVADTQNNTIRMVDRNGVVTTVAGTAGANNIGGTPGSADGQGPAAQFYQPDGVAIDSQGNIYVADTGNATIRKITPSGWVSTIAGIPHQFGAVDGPAASAKFLGPGELALDSIGNLYISDGGCTIRKLGTDGVVTTIAGQAGVQGYADGPGASALFSNLTGLATDANGNIYGADGSSIRVITPAGIVKTLAGNPPPPPIISVNPPIIDWSDGAGSAATFQGPRGVAVDAAGNVFVADSLDCAIRRVTPDGTVTTVAGQPFPLVGWADGIGSAAAFYVPSGIAVGTDGTLWIADNSTIRTGTALPLFLKNPSSQTVAAGQSAVFSMSVSNTTATTYQWLFNSAPIPGATASSLIVSVSSAANSGSYSCAATNSSGTNTTPAAALTVLTPTNPGYLANCSGLAFVGSEAQTLVGGFFLAGTGSKQLLIRAIGPGLTTVSSLSNVVANPALTIFDASASQIAQNDGWGGTTTLMSAFDEAGAFPLQPTSFDSALLLSLPVYQLASATAHIQSAGNGGGIGLFEVYDMDLSKRTARLVNASVRGFIGPEASSLTGGFVVGGSTSETLLIRAIGPGLNEFGISNPVSSAQLALYDSSGNVIATDNGWNQAPELGGSTNQAGVAAATTGIFDQVGAFELAPASGDSAVVVTLPPGAYTAQITAGGTSGFVMFEVYEVP